MHSLTICILILAFGLASGQWFIDMKVKGPGSYKAGVNTYHVTKQDYFNVTCMYNSAGTDSSVSISDKQCATFEKSRNATLHECSRKMKSEMDRMVTCTVIHLSVQENRTLNITLNASVSIKIIAPSVAPCGENHGNMSSRCTVIAGSLNAFCSVSNLTKESEPKESVASTAQTVALSDRVKMDTCLENGTRIAVVSADEDSVRWSLYNLGNLSIYPSVFNVSGGKRLSFSCASDPPALLHWSILSTRGNLFDHITTLPNLNLTIHHGINKSYLHLHENEPGENGIYMVICSTHSRIAFSRLEIHDFEMLNISRQRENQNEDPANVSVSDKPTASTVVGCTEPTDDSTCACADLQEISKYVWVSALAAPALLILNIGFVIFHCTKSRRKVLQADLSRSTNDVMYDVFPVETVSTTNIVYEPYDGNEAPSDPGERSCIDLYSSLENLKSPQPPPLPKMPQSLKGNSKKQLTSTTDCSCSAVTSSFSSRKSINNNEPIDAPDRTYSAVGSSNTSSLFGTDANKTEETTGKNYYTCPAGASSPRRESTSSNESIIKSEHERSTTDSSTVAVVKIFRRKVNENEDVADEMDIESQSSTFLKLEATNNNEIIDQAEHKCSVTNSVKVSDDSETERK